MEFLFDNDRPIYVQLVETLRTAIVSGEYPPGARLPSVRELAIRAQVNPNTMQRALQQVEDEGLIYTERTNGKFVTKAPAKIADVKRGLALEKAKAFLAEMEGMGLSRADAVQLLIDLGGDENGIA
ncbi:MAG: GntR family transcriptional regulator [Clostridia bacterium]|nr:GntR family transcriptional regulator [Clostridia bacterium]